ncbi:MAG: hypothetical protein DRH17_02640 [Deltaproteobacteria bacterium]|nr:MAG: hypothetical protein DRH17_02640 [Deltaproteobacteria bacterium]
MNKFPTKEDQEDEVPFEREIRINGEPPDFSCQDETRDLRLELQIEKLNHRITLWSILIPSLLITIVLFAYLHMRERLDNIKNIGSKEVRALYEDVVDKIESLSHQYRDLEKSLADRLSAFEKSSASIQKDLKRNQREIKKLTTAKVDQETLEQAIKKQSAEVANGLVTLRAELNKQKRTVENLDQTLKKEVAGLIQAVESIRSDGQERNSAIKDLSKRKVEKKEFDRFLKNERATYQATISLLEKKIESLKGEISRLEKRVNLAVKRHAVSEAEIPHPKEKPAAETARDTLIPAPGKIIEQEITE